MLKKTLSTLRESLGHAGDRDSDQGTDDPDPTSTNRTVTDGGSVDSRTRSQLYADTGFEPDEYVERLLEDNEGRLRQSDVREATRLSPSTTSRLLSEMEDSGQIVRINDGREKVVCLPAHTPALASPSPN